MSDEETVKVTFNMSVSYSINTDYTEVMDTGVGRAEWDAMTPEERRKVVDPMYEAFVWEQIDGGWEVAED